MLNNNELNLIKKIFSSYYSSAKFDILDIDKREFGVGYDKKINYRHLSFDSISSFKRYLLSNIPFFVSHSTSYYEFPDATPIEKKNRLRADIVFDLDIHAEGKYAVYSKLDEAKEDLERLVYDFLISDFGLDISKLLIVFSGNRGYHVHIRDENFSVLGTDERKELVDYIRGVGLNYLTFFSHTHGHENEKLYGPKPGEGGYRGRFARRVLEVLNSKPSKIARIFSDKKRKNVFVNGIEKGIWSNSSLKTEDLLNRFSFISKELSINSVDADAPVTTDMSKLIRVPNSIHGETGMVARIIQNPKSFNPLNDAFLRTDNKLKIKFLEDIPKLEVLSSTFGPYKKSEIVDINLSLALFYILKKSAVLSK